MGIPRLYFMGILLRPAEEEWSRPRRTSRTHHRTLVGRLAPENACWSFLEDSLRGVGVPCSRIMGLFFTGGSRWAFASFQPIAAAWCDDNTPGSYAKSRQHPDGERRRADPERRPSRRSEFSDGGLWPRRASRAINSCTANVDRYRLLDGPDGLAMVAGMELESVPQLGTLVLDHSVDELVALSEGAATFSTRRFSGRDRSSVDCGGMRRGDRGGDSASR